MYMIIHKYIYIYICIYIYIYYYIMSGLSQPMNLTVGQQPQPVVIEANQTNSQTITHNCVLSFLFFVFVIPF